MTSPLPRKWHKDFHQAPETFEPRRRWLATLASPHVNLTARISTPGGHGADWADENTTRWANTPEGGRAAISAIAPYRPDLIKVFPDGWRYGNAPDNTSMNEPTLQAIVEAAHARGLKVVTHTVTMERGAIAARACVDLIVHSIQDREIDPDTAALMRERKIAYAPTLAVYEPIKPGASPPTPIRRERSRSAKSLPSHRPTSGFWLKQESQSSWGQTPA